jgi:hypothetical protein
MSEGGWQVVGSRQHQQHPLCCTNETLQKIRCVEKCHVTCLAFNLLPPSNADACTQTTYQRQRAQQLAGMYNPHMEEAEVNCRQAYIQSTITSRLKPPAFDMQYGSDQSYT